MQSGNTPSTVAPRMNSGVSTRCVAAAPNAALSGVAVSLMPRYEPDATKPRRAATMPNARTRM